MVIGRFPRREGFMAETHKFTSSTLMASMAIDRVVRRVGKSSRIGDDLTLIILDLTPISEEEVLGPRCRILPFTFRCGACGLDQPHRFTGRVSVRSAEGGMPIYHPTQGFIQLQTEKRACIWNFRFEKPAQRGHIGKLSLHLVHITRTPPNHG